MKLQERVEAFIKLGQEFSLLISFKTEGNMFEEVIRKSHHKNPWFTPENVRMAFSAWSDELVAPKINKWIIPYLDQLEKNQSHKTIGVINAGNIPLVGFHDFLTVILSGNNYLGKNSSDDPYLLPYIAELLIEIEPGLKKMISFAEKLTGFDAVIATGSNNSARYFDYYFGKYPHIIRMNRNAVAILYGNEDINDYKKLGQDIFQYFGLGCRNVSKLYVPSGYVFNAFFEAIESFSSVSQHNKYMNNHDYNNAIYLLKKITFLDNGFLLVKEDESIASPISVLYFEYYTDLKALEQKLETQKEMIQCVTSKEPFTIGKGSVVEPGQTQHPQLRDYADGIDTMKFLLSLQD